VSRAKLLELLELASAGAAVDKGLVEQLQLDDVPLGARKVAEEAWHQLMHYADDGDIHSRDADYARDQMESMGWYASRLREQA
jgi:hypothetical protein